MPLWKIYCPVGVFSDQDKTELAQRITERYAKQGMPRFYVGVIFNEVAKNNFFIGGCQRDDFVRITCDHIARASSSEAERERSVRMHDENIAPFVRDRGLSWEFHIDETSRELWSTNGIRPPLHGSEEAKRWAEANRPLPHPAG